MSRWKSAVTEVLTFPPSFSYITTIPRAFLSNFSHAPLRYYYPTNIWQRKWRNISDRKSAIRDKLLSQIKRYFLNNVKKWDRNFEKFSRTFVRRGILLILFCPFCRSKFFSGQRSTGTMSHNILLGRFLPADRLFEGGSDAETGDLRVPSWANDVAPCGRSPPRRPRRRRRKAFRDPLLQERRWVISLLITDYTLHR